MNLFLKHSVEALGALCAQLTRDLLAIAKFLLTLPMAIGMSYPTVLFVAELESL